jgi:hypothetical protein
LIKLPLFRHVKNCDPACQEPSSRKYPPRLDLH